MTDQPHVNPDVNIELRDGSVVHDPRLDRLVQFDERSRNFPIRAMVGGNKPRSYTWRMDARLDQGQEGACVGFGWTHELVARPKALSNLANDAFARQNVYWEAQRIDPWTGGAYPGATPFYEGTSVLAGALVLRNLGYVGEFRWAFSLEDVVLAIGYKGPAAIGVDWHSGMFDTDANGFIWPTGAIGGGHCVMLNRVKVVWRDGTSERIWANVDLDRSFLEGVNSWGRNWGEDGKFRMTLNAFDQVRRAQGEVCIPVERHWGPRA